VSRIEALRENYAGYVARPQVWDPSLPPAQRVWFAVYDPAEERRLRLRIPSFEEATRKADRGWRGCDLTDAFAEWMAAHDYREAYFESPEDLPMPHPDFEEFVASKVRRELEQGDENTVVAVMGAIALFGFMRVSRLVDLVEEAIRGRLLVFFPGSYDPETHQYRFLDARDGWNYHAVPITAEGGFLP